jgi:hypothetical protein
MKSLWRSTGPRFFIRLATIVVIVSLRASSAWALPGTSNLASAGTATATSTEFGASIEDGIDGNRDGNFGNGSVYYSSNGAANNPLFYEVDLGVDAYIDRVQVLRRTDADQGVFGNLRLTIFQDDGAGNPGAAAFQHDYLPSFQTGTFATTDPGGSAPGGVFGRHVRLERIDPNYWLTFAEFEVIGSTTPLKFTAANNLAAGKPVTSSSPPGYGAQTDSGNDGDVNADFYGAGAPVWHSTDAGAGQYWKVDLQNTYALDTIELFARGDGTNTSQYLISVLDAGQNVVGTRLVDNAAYNASTPDFDHTIDALGLTGRYIRVETTRGEHLSFAELRAFAVPEPTQLAGLGTLVVSVAARRRRR